MKFFCFLLAMITPVMSWASTATIAVIKLSEQAFVLTAIDYGTNIGLLNTADGIVLVDPMPGEVNLDALHAKIQQLVGARRH